ncbi:uncharacterized protein LOC133820923 isoform X1 [Humulus lupulus]|uniref:uncharacterized protein LOC133820923 isoform X1 n=1 Tax=Humulus lupulus TaxID=3486 RepID=UPI002B40E583|nr:uncharacterized protein LOC133820923 isoform X1 [Humulus lupulus]
MLELQEGVDQLKLPATISSLCVIVESLEKKLFAKENEMDKFKEEMKIELEMGLQRLQQSLSTPNHHVIQIDNFKEEMKLYFDKGFERLHQSFNIAIGSMVPGNASPHISKEKAAKCVQFGKLTKDLIEPTIYLHEKTKLSQHKMTIDPMLLECGIGRRNEFEDSYRKGSISNIEREKGAIENDFNDYEQTVLPSDKYNVDVGPYNAIQNVDGVLSCSGNEKIDVENEIGLEDDASKFRVEGKEKEKEDLGILSFEVIPERSQCVWYHRHSCYSRNRG